MVAVRNGVLLAKICTICYLGGTLQVNGGCDVVAMAQDQKMHEISFMSTNIVFQSRHAFDTGSW